jgi:hypothetical protein
MLPSVSLPDVLDRIPLCLKRARPGLLLAVVLAAAIGLAGPAPSRAQAPAGEPARQGGTAVLVDWPRSLPDLLEEMGRRAPRLLPRLDSMALDYRYAVDSSRSRWSFALSWRPGDRVLDRGRVRPWREAPPDVRMVSVELLADVYVAGRKQAEMVVAVDTMALRPMPDGYRFNVAVDHDRVFLDTGPQAARRHLRRGVVLANLRVERMGFASFEDADGRAQRPPREPDARRRRPPAPSVYEPRTNVVIGWRIGPRPYYVGEDRRRRPAPERAPRGDAIGRTAPSGDGADGESARRGDRDRTAPETGEAGPEGGGAGEAAAPDERDRSRGDRSGGDTGDARGRPGGRSGDDGDRADKDDEEDEPSLAMPALAAAGAVAVFAYTGGTVGLYGNAETPLGVAAGYTHPRGGVQLQAAVNPALLEGDGTQRLTARVLGFYDVLGAPVRPALGLGVQAVSRPGRVAVEPSVAVGAVGTVGRFVFYGGVDVAQGAPEAGVAFNFRGGSGDKDADPPVAARNR